jgi:hypothetical protein
MSDKIAGQTITRVEFDPEMIDASSTRASLLPIHRDKIASASEILSLVLPDSVLQTCFVDPINCQFEGLRLSNPQTVRYAPIDVRDFRVFLLTFVLRTVSKNVQSNISVEKRAEAKTKIMGKDRTDQLQSAMLGCGESAQAVLQAISSAIEQIVVPGTIVTGDETMIEYFGRDMIRAGDQMFIPRKPHPFGILALGLFWSLEYTGLPLGYSFDIRMGSNKPSSSEGMIKLMRKATAWASPLGVPLRFHLDSGFSASQILAEARLLSVEVVQSIRQGSGGGYEAESLLVTGGLKNHASRSLNIDGIEFQATNNDAHITLVASNICTDRQGYVEQLKMSYTEAVKVCSTKSAATIATHLKIPSQVGISPHAVSSYLCGHDTMFPEPNVDGKSYITPQTLGKMRKWQLVLLAKAVHVDNAQAKKPELAENIYIELCRNQPVLDDFKNVILPRTESDNTDFLNSLRDLASEEAPLVEAYCAHYGFQDRYNRFMYTIFEFPRANHRHTRVAHFVVFHAVLSAYMLWAENIVSKTQLNEIKKTRWWDSQTAGGFSRFLEEWISETEIRELTKKKKGHVSRTESDFSLLSLLRHSRELSEIRVKGADPLFKVAKMPSKPKPLEIVVGRSESTPTGSGNSSDDAMAGVIEGSGPVVLAGVGSSSNSVASNKKKRGRPKKQTGGPIPHPLVAPLLPPLTSTRSPKLQRRKRALQVMKVNLFSPPRNRNSMEFVTVAGHSLRANANIYRKVLTPEEEVTH